MLLTVKIIIWLVILVIVGFIYLLTFALCRAASLGDRHMERWEEEVSRSKEVEEIAATKIDEIFDGWKYCDDDCYMCDNQGKCERSAMKYK